MRTGIPRIVPAIAAGVHRLNRVATARCANWQQPAPRRAMPAVTEAHETTPPLLARPHLESAVLVVLWLAGLGGIAVSIATAF